MSNFSTLNVCAWPMLGAARMVAASTANAVSKRLVIKASQVVAKGGDCSPFNMTGRLETRRHVFAPPLSHVDPCGQDGNVRVIDFAKERHFHLSMAWRCID